jgi:hypothetical protein
MSIPVFHAKYLYRARQLLRCRSSWNSGTRRRLGSLQGLSNQDFLYAKVGREDAFAFPDLVPGSIVRIDPTIGNDLAPGRNGTTSKRLFLA